MLLKRISTVLFMGAALLFACNPQPSETESDAVDAAEEALRDADELSDDVVDAVDRAADDAVDAAENAVDPMTEKVNAEGAVNYFTDPEGNIIYTFLVEENMPSFAEGSLQDYLSEQLVYPQESEENGSEGTVVVTFVVSKTGEVHSARVVKPTNDELLNAEALRVVERMPRWNPGMKEGQPVGYKYNLPVVFKLKQ